MTDEPINPLTLALTAGAAFIAGICRDIPGLTKLMQEAILHKGFYRRRAPAVCQF